MKTEAGKIPSEVRANLRYAEITEAVTELGLAMIDLTDELERDGFADAAIVYLTTIADGKIGLLRQKFLLLETASGSEYLDQWLGEMRELMEFALEPVTGLIEFAREDKTKLLTEEYAKRIELGNSGLKSLYLLWGLPIPGEAGAPLQLTSSLICD